MKHFTHEQMFRGKSITAEITLFKAVNCPVVVSAGIHYDNASKKEILQVVEISNVLLEMGTSKLRSV